MVIDLLSEISPQDKTSLGEIKALDMTGGIRKKMDISSFLKGVSYHMKRQINWIHVIKQHVQSGHMRQVLEMDSWKATPRDNAF